MHKHLLGKNAVAILLSWGLLTGTFLVNAHEKYDNQQTEIHLRGSWSGAYFNTESDTDGDGEKVINFRGGFNSNIGPGTFDFVAENPALLKDAPNCPKGHLGIPNAVLERGVLRFENGDLLFVEVPTHTGCADLSVPTFTFLEDGLITGGTGHFANAKGTFHDETEAPILDLRQNFRFGYLTGKIKATFLINSPW